MPLNSGENVAIAECPRCHFKVQYADMKQDPNNRNWYCKDCIDIFDPWRLPAPVPENISLDHARPETEIAVTGSDYPYPPGTQNNGGL